MKQIYKKNLLTISINMIRAVCFIIIVLLINTAFSQTTTAQKTDIQPVMNYQIFDAIKQGEVTTVKELLKKDPNLLNIRDKDERTLLHVAARCINLDLIELLVSNGASVNVKDNNGVTPLHSVVYRGNIEAVELLISNGADVNIQHKSGGTPLHCAAYGGHKEVAELLLEKGADINAIEYQGMTPLHHAAYNGQREVASLLVNKGSEINAVNNSDWTPLHFATHRGYKKIADILIENGAKLNVHERSGKIPLHLAAYHGHKNIIKLLIARGSDIDALEFQEMTPLHQAASGGQKEASGLLIDKGAVVNSKDINGKTPLMYAVLKGHVEVAELLMDKGAMIDVREKHYGRTLFHLTAIIGNKNMAEFLINKGAGINVLDNEGLTPLQLAAKYGHKEVAGMLTKRGAIAIEIEENYDNSTFLQKELNEGEAFIWYLGHSGWAIKTKNHLLIFDYWERETKPAEPFLSNGYINPNGIKDMDIFVFVTHEHIDHFDKTIFDWGKTVDNITYIFGWQAAEDSMYIYMVEPREKKKLDGIDIFTINHSFDGIPEVAYLVKVDGLVIFHSGDHGCTGEELNPIFKNNIDYLTEIEEGIDIAFISSFGSDRGADVNKGDLYTIEQLLPKITFPMHLGGNEHLYKEFAREAEKEKANTKIHCAENRGDRFFYQNGEIK